MQQPQRERSSKAFAEYDGRDKSVYSKSAVKYEHKRNVEYKLPDYCMEQGTFTFSHSLQTERRMVVKKLDRIKYSGAESNSGKKASNVRERIISLAFVISNMAM